jgi:hypothetical protein
MGMPAAPASPFVLELETFFENALA